MNLFDLDALCRAWRASPNPDQAVRAGQWIEHALAAEVSRKSASGKPQRPDQLAQLLLVKSEQIAHEVDAGQALPGEGLVAAAAFLEQALPEVDDLLARRRLIGRIVMNRARAGDQGKAQAILDRHRSDISRRPGDKGAAQWRAGLEARVRYWTDRHAWWRQVVEKMRDFDSMTGR
jgi:hypothetical protein